MISSNNIFSKDEYFILGLTGLLGVDLIDNFFLIVDLDFTISLHKKLESSGKKIVAFASSDLAFYRSLFFKNIVVLDKRSSTGTIFKPAYKERGNRELSR